METQKIVGYEVCEAGSPLALDNGWFTTLEYYMKSYEHSKSYSPPINQISKTLIINPLISISEAY